MAKQRVQISMKWLPDAGWIRFLLLSLLLTIAYYATLATPLVSAACYALVGLSSLLAIAYSIRTHRTTNPSAWLWIGSGILLYFIGDLTYNYFRVVLGETSPFPSAADAFFLLARFPLIIGLMQIVRRTGRDSAYSLLDTLIVASGLALIWWAFLMAPEAYSPHFSPLERFIAIAYPATDFLLLATGIRLAFTSIKHNAPAVMMGAALFGLLGADIVYSLLQFNHQFQVGTWVDLGWIGFYVFFGALALYPKTDIVPVPANLSSTRLAWRLGLLTVAVLLLPITIALSRFGFDVIDWASVVIGTTLILLVMLRLQRLMQQNLALQRELSVWKSDRLFKSIIDQAYSGVCVVLGDLTIAYSNPRMSELADLGSTQPNLAKIIHPEDLPRFQRFWHDTLGPKRTISSVEYRLRMPGGDWRDVESTSNNLLTDEWIHGVVVITADISERKTYERKLQKMAYTDALTGLPNRTALTELIQTGVIEAGKHQRQMAVLFLDLDNFRSVNDSLGHTCGDQVLVQLAKRLSATLGPGSSVARFGGDEFIVVSPSVREPADARLLYQRVIAQLDRPFQVDAYRIALTASCGIALCDNLATTDHIIRNADLALHRAKLAGPGSMRIYNAQLLLASQRRLELSTALRETLTSTTAADSPYLLYQPVFDLRTRRLTAAVAVPLWRHPKFGNIEPAELIATAAESELLDLLETLQLQQICSQLAEWSDQVAGRAFRVSLAVSMARLRRPGYDTVLLDHLHARGVPPTRLSLEITEAGLLHHDPNSFNTLANLMDKGVHIVISDFGREYSSLAQLFRMPHADLKLDPSLTGPTEKPETLPLLKSIISTAHSLGRQVLVRDVDTKEQAAGLQRLECDQAQGVFFGRPISASDFSHLLPRHTSAQEA